MDNKAERPQNSIIIKIVTIISVILAVFHVYTGAFGLMYTYTQRGFHLSMLLLIGILNYILTEKGIYKKIINVFLLLATIISFSHLFINMEYISRRLWGSPLTIVDVVTGVLLFVVIVIMGKRVIGWILPGIMLIAVAYGFLGPYLSGVFQHGGYSWRLMLEMTTWSEMGIFGMPLGVSATYLYLFVLFGVLMEKMGTGETLMDLAKIFAGRQKGGPAKLAVFASALMGTINGSPTANVLTTGAFTIPLMVKLGFEKVYSAAVVAVASTGGMILPPVMGVLAFAMVDYSGIPYSAIIKSAAIPAILYFMAVFMSVHLHAYKKDLQKFDPSQMPSARELLKKQWYTLMPVFILAVPLVVGFTPILTVSWATISLIPISFMNKDRDRWLTPKRLIAASVVASRSALQVAIPTALAGVISGVLGVTGVGIRMSSVLVDISGGNLLILLILVAIITIIMGCGLPALLAYIVQIPVTIPALVQMGIPVMGAHLFVVYYATLAFITPPVGPALYSAMAISDVPLLKVGKLAVQIGLPGFLIPFVFIYSPSLLLITSFSLDSVLAILTASVGVAILAVAVEGYLFQPLSWTMRIIFGLASVLLIIPNNLIGAPTIVVLAILIFIYYKQAHSAKSYINN